ncbi:MAG: hypothetical protein MUE53_08055, partial [Chitinophagales bacterium]|nr:hypothetical protein [Chitinophagales bacterium]
MRKIQTIFLGLILAFYADLSAQSLHLKWSAEIESNPEQKLKYFLKTDQENILMVFSAAKSAKLQYFNFYKFDDSAKITSSKGNVLIQPSEDPKDFLNIESINYENNRINIVGYTVDLSKEVKKYYLFILNSSLDIEKMVILGELSTKKHSLFSNKDYNFIPLSGIVYSPDASYFALYNVSAKTSEKSYVIECRLYDQAYKNIWNGNLEINFKPSQVNISNVFVTNSGQLLFHYLVNQSKSSFVQNSKLKNKLLRFNPKDETYKEVNLELDKKFIGSLSVMHDQDTLRVYALTTTSDKMNIIEDLTVISMNNALDIIKTKSVAFPKHFQDKLSAESKKSEPFPNNYLLKDVIRLTNDQTFMMFEQEFTRVFNDIRFSQIMKKFENIAVFGFSRDSMITSNIYYKDQGPVDVNSFQSESFNGVKYKGYVGVILNESEENVLANLNAKYKVSRLGKSNPRKNDPALIIFQGNEMRYFPIKNAQGLAPVDFKYNNNAIFALIKYGKNFRLGVLVDSSNIIKSL